MNLTVLNDYAIYKIHVLFFRWKGSQPNLDCLLIMHLFMYSFRTSWRMFCFSVKCQNATSKGRTDSLRLGYEYVCFTDLETTQYLKQHWCQTPSALSGRGKWSQWVRVSCFSLQRTISCDGWSKKEWEITKRQKFLTSLAHDGGDGGI